MVFFKNPSYWMF